MRRVLVLSLVLTAGCSIFLKGVDDKDPKTADECQPFIIVPIIDGVLGAGLLAWAIGQPCQDGVVGCAFGVAGAGALIGAGVYGYLKVRKCQRAKDAARGGDDSGIGGDEFNGALGPPLL